MPYPNKTFLKMSPEKLKEVQSKGGKKVTAKQRLSQQLRRMREKGATNEGIKDMVLLLESRDATAADILHQIKILEYNQDLTFNEKSQIIAMYCAWLKLHHGEKKELDITMTQLQTLTDDEVNEVIERL